MGKIKIAVLAGGWSREREISIMSGNAAYKALDKKKYDVTMYDPKNKLRELMAQKENIDLAFNLLHGKYGEDGCMQGMLDILGIPFVGSGVLSSAMTVNKKVTKDIYRNEGLTVAPDIVVTKGEDFSVEEIITRIGIQTVVKPLDEGSSVGMSLCGNREELAAGIETAFECGHKIMIEQLIVGQEVTCCVLGNIKLDTLPIIEIVPKEQYRFFDYEAKYTPGATEEICPAQLAEKTQGIVIEYAKKAHQALGCSVWSRTDMIVKNKNVYLLETNTVPGMTENSLFPLAARTAGISFSELLDRLIALSFEKER
ncbi:MAG: D-alanine--D-alanine ligase [Deltaproteobacteria bacterium]|nr:D-alanine--D-alanine ligase [Deltaproteobacteria bacterium]